MVPKTVARRRTGGKSVPETVATLIRQRILRGELSPGDRITEAELSRKLRVGQPTVREALFVLERQGLVRRVANTGTFVTKLDVREASNLFQIRAELDALAAELAACNASEADLTALRHLVSNMRQAAKAEDNGKYLENDMAFHRRLWELSGNEHLAAMLETIVLPLFIFCLAHERRTAEEVERSAEAHLHLVDALAAGPEKARATIEEHNRQVFHQFVAATLYSDRLRGDGLRESGGDT